jgi:hypothetical protein
VLECVCLTNVGGHGKRGVCEETVPMSLG